MLNGDIEQGNLLWRRYLVGHDVNEVRCDAPSLHVALLEQQRAIKTGQLVAVFYLGDDQPLRRGTGMVVRPDGPSSRLEVAQDFDTGVDCRVRITSAQEQARRR
ncbi:hypothetical protein D3C77_668960 [compost metagenome]